MQWLDGNDLTGRWMAYHLARLIADATEDAATTPEQRIAIVDLIRRLWESRRSFPNRQPAHDLDTVMTALDLLGDSTPYRFAKLEDLGLHTPAGSTSGPGLLSSAVALERECRQAVATLALLGLAAASAEGTELLELAEQVEEDATGGLARSVSTARQRLLQLKKAPSHDGTPKANDGAFDLSERADALRNMAELLVGVAAQLDAAEPPPPRPEQPASDQG